MTKTEILGVLEQSKIFSGLPTEHLEWLAEHATERHFDDGRLVARQGELARHFLLVLEGELIVEVPALTGPSLEVAVLGPGAAFGWSWLIEPFRWHFNARAESTTRVLEFDGDAIRGRCSGDKSFGYELLKRFSALMGTRLEAAHRRMKEHWAPDGLP